MILSKDAFAEVTRIVMIYKKIVYPVDTEISIELLQHIAKSCNNGNKLSMVALKRFYAFLMKCNCIVKGQYWNTLDSPENLSCIVLKRPARSK